jgi:hypothetical protein
MSKNKTKEVSVEVPETTPDVVPVEVPDHTLYECTYTFNAFKDGKLVCYKYGDIISLTDMRLIQYYKNSRFIKPYIKPSTKGNANV